MLNLSLRDTPKPIDWPARLPMAVGLISTLLLVGGFGSWSVFASLEGAVVAPGRLEVESNRQVIQHAEGGVVGEILVHDGDTVAAGQVLLRLDGARTRSELAIVEGQLADLAARQARLEAERDGAAEVIPGAAFDGQTHDGADFTARLESERSLFRARIEAMAQEQDLLAEQSAQIRTRIEGTEAQLAAMRRQVALLSEDLQNKHRLQDQGLIEATLVLNTERELTSSEGQIGALQAQVAEMKAQIAANGIASLQVETKRREEAVTQLRDIQGKALDLSEQALALRETLSRLDIRAPMAGIVYGSKVFARQSVVNRAEPLLYIIPQDQPLVVSARVDGTKIDEIKPGQAVSLRFSAFDAKDTQPVPGHVTQISADVLTDEATRQSYYALRIEPDPEAVKALAGRLVPGMPVEAYVTTGARSPLAYLFHPFTSYFEKAFRN